MTGDGVTTNIIDQDNYDVQWYNHRAVVNIIIMYDVHKHA